MTAASSSKNWLNSGGLAAMGLTALWLMIWRGVLDTPWGLAPVSTPGGFINIGIVCNPVDTWSYLSWVQQYYHGTTLAGLLYTTEPHASLLWLFPLWLSGRLAAWTGLPVIGTYNALGLAGAMAAVFCFLRAAAALRLPASARHWAVLALVCGSGGSWFWHLAHKLGLAPRADGGDLFFLDLFPSTALIAYAYHAVGLALLAGLWWSTCELESRRLAGAAARGWFGATLGIALLLGFSRPYEPVAFLGAWFLKTAWHARQWRREPAVARNSVVIGAWLLLALLPGIGWTMWVSTQPVWSSFARESLALGIGRGAWFWGLGGWAVLAALGIGPARRADPRLATLPIAASVLLAVILFGLGSAHTKLASGLILGPLLLAGWGAARIVAAAGRLAVPFRVGAVALLLSALFGVPSLFMNLNAMKLNGPTWVDEELFALARRLPFVPGQPPPIVLTGASTGGILPGLSGARVWAGHWSLSGHYTAKVDRLKLAGLDPQTRTTDPVAANRALDAILADTHFDYALIDRHCAPAIAGLTGRGWQLIETTARWKLLQSPRSP